MLKRLTVVLAFIVLALVVAAAGLMPARAQGLPAKPAGVSVAAGARAGEVTVSWQAADDATLYRIGWVAFDKIVAVRNAGRPWLDAFAFTDVTNYGQATHPLDGLLPGVQYAFIVGSVNSRFGVAAWSDWVYLTTAEAASRCPAGAGNPPEPQTPDPTPTPTPDPNATPTPTPDPNATPTATPEPDPAVTPTPTPTAVPVGTDYDRDDNGLIEIASLAQLDAIRHDLDGDGVSAHTTGYAEAFPDAAAGMGCFRRQCQGYELVANLDFDTNGNGHIDEGDDWWDEGDGWIPIGDPETALRYNAVFDGNNHTIANLYIVWPDTTHIGLFRATGEDAVIRNLGLTSVFVSGGTDRVGALVGESGGAVSNSYAAGEVRGGGRVGGLVGYSSGSIAGSYSSASVSGTDPRVGGLVGSNAGSIVDSYANGNVTGEGGYVAGFRGIIGYVGGLVGIIGSNGSISGSYATGSVTSEGSSVGGLVGRSDGHITDSHATGSVTSEGSSVGGLIGSSGSTVTASHATGNVTSEKSNVGGLVGTSSDPIIASYATGGVTGAGGTVGGLVGYSSGVITASYATSNVTGKGSFVGGLVGFGRYTTIIDSYAVGSITSETADVGGLVGSCYYNSPRYRCSTTSSYWDTQTTGQVRSRVGTGKTTREMQRPTGPTGIYAGWDPEYWDFGTSRQYPALKYDGMDVGAQRR